MSTKTPQVVWRSTAFGYRSDPVTTATSSMLVGRVTADNDGLFSGILRNTCARGGVVDNHCRSWKTAAEAQAEVEKWIEINHRLDAEGRDNG